jgi:NADPH-dependent 2,4-dienoyl-CoA reductase/sulfur reductase-like enzyme/nitrite reductase/ring-hydroxylating ferredoxin subunit
MASDTGPTMGPDLRQGVPEDRIPDGGMIEGQVDGEPVILVRRGARFYAVGARCSHYGGPLAQGLVVGDTVRCPLHHACFDLHTGRALRGPALAPLPCFAVERRLDLVRVTGPAAVPAPTRTIAGGSSSSAIVIVGAGAAGTGAALALRSEGYTGRVTLIDVDPASPYDRPNLSKDYLAGTAPEEWLPLRSHEDLARQDIRLVLGVPVLRVEPTDRMVRVADGRAFPYDALLLATGAEPLRLELPGIDDPRVETLRSLADSRRLIAKAETARTAVVLGAGFLGLEVAASFRARGLSVHVVAPDQRPLEKVLGRELGQRLQRLHEEHGVAFHLGHVATAIGEEAVRLDDGSDIQADLVVVAVGARPRVSLASRAGLVLARGIQVDQYLETSMRGIFAAGDVARWPDPRTGRPIGVEHWAFAMRQGQAAARNMLGAREPFLAVPFFWSQHYDLQVNYVGHSDQWDRLEIVPGLPPGEWEQHYMVGDTVVAVATIGRDRQSLEAEVLLERAQQRNSGAHARPPAVAR